ncbi:MAG: hypothetical protein ACFWTJ_06490 [Lachnoclostridium sp.]|jgi:hypothetical protein
MATTNANDSRPSKHRDNARLSGQKSPGTYGEAGYPTSGQGKQDGKPVNRESKPFNVNKSSNGSFNRENKLYGKDSKSYPVKDILETSSFSRNRDLSIGGYRAKTFQTKEKEQQPDKLVTIKRLEREKKALLKKKTELDEKAERRSKPQIKHRRTKNIDWTRGYANGLYGDDDENYTEYM